MDNGKNEDSFAPDANNIPPPPPEMSLPQDQPQAQPEASLPPQPPQIHREAGMPQQQMQYEASLPPQPQVQHEVSLPQQPPQPQFRPQPQYAGFAPGAPGAHPWNGSPPNGGYPGYGNGGYNYGNYGYGAPQAAYPPPRRRAENSAMKAALIIVSVIILIAATALIFMDTPRAQVPDMAFITPAPSAEATDSPTFPGLFPEWSAPVTAAPAAIPRGELGSGIVMSLTSKSEAEALPLTELYKQCSQWVVAIEADVDDYSYNWGTGILISPDGFIITNNHIIEGTVSARITLFDDTVHDALLIGADSHSDLAVLKIDAGNLPFAVFGDSSELEVGEDVVAIGNPLGREFRSTLTDGIISAIDRSVVVDGGYSMTLLQTNAAINEGNSGGPLINLFGQIVGITNMKMISYYQGIEGIGFAIPSRQMKTIVDQLIENGYAVGAPMLGITGGPANADEGPPGVYVETVNRRADAYRSGLRPGDIITAANGESIASVEDLNRIKSELGVGDSLTLSVYRDGRTFDIDIVLMDGNKLE